MRARIMLGVTLLGLCAGGLAAMPARASSCDAGEDCDDDGGLADDGGTAQDDAGLAVGPDASTEDRDAAVAGAGGGAGSGGSGDEGPASDDGCNCAVVGADGRAGSGSWMAFGVGAFLLLRRRTLARRARLRSAPR